MKDREYCRKYHQEIIKYDINALSRRIIDKNIFIQKYNRDVYTAEEGNCRLEELINSGKPFMAGRFGGNELRTISDILYEKNGGRLGGLSNRTRYKITNQAGFFPDDKEEIYRFAELYLDSAIQVDLLGIWDMFLQAEIVKRFLPGAQLTELRALEPYYHEKPWSSALMGKRVLVIHPFSQSIKMQYEKRTQLFDNEYILPEFQLRTVKAVQTIAGQRDTRFTTWFDALEYMFNEAMNEEFDIALIGCGAYGFPLAVKLKQAGKQAIHMGGSLQILFGIKGTRWDNHETIAGLYKDSWVRPSDSEKVSGSDIVEKSCYW